MPAPSHSLRLYTSMVVQPAVWLNHTFERDAHAIAGPHVLDPSAPEGWQWSGMVPVFDCAQVRFLNRTHVHAAVNVLNCLTSQGCSLKPSVG